MALLKNRQVEILSYDDKSEQSQVRVFNKELNTTEIVNSDELTLTDDEFKKFVSDKQKANLDTLQKQREADKADEQKRSQELKKQDKTDSTVSDKKNK